MLVLGFSLYALNLAVGVGALLGMRFGVWHHVLYAAVFASAIAATLWAFHPGLLLTLAALGLMPKTRPRTPWHPAVAVLGALGYVLAFTT